MKKKFVTNTNEILKNSLVKPPIFNEKRFLNIGECVDYTTSVLTTWNAHSWLTCDYDIDPEITYGNTTSGHLYVLFTSPTKSYLEYSNYYDYIRSDAHKTFVISSYSDSFNQVLTQLYPFLPEVQKIKFRMLDQIRMSVEIVKNKFMISFKNNSYLETIPELGKIEYDDLVIFLLPQMVWMAHFFYGNDKVQVFTHAKSDTFIPTPNRTAGDKRILLAAKLDDSKKEKPISYNDLPKDYWPEPII